ncbi:MULTISPECIES: efflux RND transporter periplasmic adaptor subunit [unclassified Shewanella]|uniref:efflux RND transporter periplasmic adaptor subunit n=1 Tax=unclassified Shewanella TaxID=196818 RepID=UPI001BC69A71|nr:MULTISPECIES: efflux RND transporter periplasmic adaptor subunit [unclassified Shewanella]GIU07770.1 RND transporter [Shewanella sp. MBTL60-112-B1]GIU30406.1 RND transporter [Shewanella sp. MBTL60-112-B2]
MKQTAIVICVLSSLLTGCGDQVVTQVESGILEQQIEVTGELVSANTVNLKPPALRRVWQYQVKMLAPEGSQVKKGDRVAQLDTSTLTQRLSVKSANLATTAQDIETSKLRNAKKLEELKLDLAEAKMNQEKSQMKVDISDETVSVIDQQKYLRDAIIAKDRVSLIKQKIELEIEGAQQRMKMLEGDQQKFAAEVAALKKGIKSLTLIAPRDGMVVYGNDQQGNKLAEGQNIYGGDSVLSIPDLQHMQVNMTIPEVEAGRVQVGQALKIRLDANPEKTFNGKIIELGAVFRIKNQDVPLVIFDAVASIDEVDSGLMRPGMTAKISIDIANKTPELLLSLDAVHYDRGKAYVIKPGLFSDSKQYVSLGAMGKEQVVVTQGIEQGEEVLLP